jgi:HTH-type transcriptional regulator / antitoxin HigA
MSVLIERRSYNELIETVPLRPIRNKSQYRRAAAMLDKLAVRDEGTLSREEQDYLETLSLLVEDYDRKEDRSAVRGVGPVQVLKHLMEENDMNTSDLGRLLGSKGVASEVLNGKRKLSKSHIMTLAQRFNVDVSLFFPQQ